jgi:competence protein ComEC
MKTGTMHIFAISGLHIALIAGILVSCFAVLRVPRTVCGAFVVPAIWFYTMATGWQPSAIRSTVMMSVVLVGWSLRRPSNLLNSLASAGTILLLWDPRQLFQPSFQLSFFVVLGMALLTPIFEHFYRPSLPGDPLISPDLITWKTRWARAMIRRGLQPDPLTPAELVPWHVLWRQRAFRVVGASVSTSLAAWIASLPLIVWYFNLFTPVSLFANLIIVPISTLALMSNLGGILCAWVEPLAVLFNHSAWFWMWLMRKLCIWMAGWPFAAIYLPKPTMALCILFYITVFGAFSGWLWIEKWRLPKCSILGLAWMLALGHVCLSQPLAKITVLSLRSGDAIFIDELGKARDLLIDGSDAASGEFLTRSFLHAQGVNRVPRLLLTHGDVQHCAAASNLVQTFNTKEIITSPVKFRSKPYRDLLDHLDTSGLARNKVGAGDRIGRWTVLHPPNDTSLALADDQVLVLRGNIGGCKILLCSDLGRRGQRNLLDRGTDLSADILVAAMPASSAGLSEDLIRAVQPKAVILTAPNRPGRKTVQTEMRDRFESQGITLFDTAEDGSATLRFQRGSVVVQTTKGPAMAIVSQDIPRR